MRVLLISSSPHGEKSDTFVLAKQTLQGVYDQGGRGDFMHLAECSIDYCRHCQECHKKILRCPIKDSIPVILNAMLQADGIILATPNYIGQVTASMKAIFERSTHFIHCKRLLDKYVVGVVSSGSSQDKGILDYIKHYANICGAQYSGGVLSTELTIESKLQEAYQLGRKLAEDIKNQKTYSDQIKIIKASREHFKKLIKSKKNEWKGEFRYWRHKRWL